VRRDTLRQEIAARLAQKSWDRKRDREFATRIMERAQVDAKRLTDSPEWNIYLQQVEALNERDCKALEALQSALETPTYMTADACQRLQFDCAVLIARIQARNECIDIPKRIQGAADPLDQGSDTA
jgi:hypothetical protein